MERVTRRFASPRPHRHGEHHDVHGGEAGDRRCAIQSRGFGVAFVVAMLRKACIEACALQRLHDRWRLPARAPSDGNPAGGQIQARAHNAIEPREAAFNGGDASAATRLRHEKVCLLYSVPQISARQQKFLGRQVAAGNERRCRFNTGGAAAHGASSGFAIAS